MARNGKKGSRGKKRYDEDEAPKEVPFDPVSEQAVVASMMHDAATAERLVPRTSPDDMYGQRHRVILSVLKSMITRGLTYDHATFAAAARDMEFTPRDYGGDSYLHDLADTFEDVENLDYHLARMKREARLRTCADDAGERLLASMRCPAPDVAVVAATAREVLTAARGADETGAGTVRGEQAAEEYRERFAMRMSGNPDFVPFGVKELDEVLTWGAFPGKVTVLAGRPSNGKSSLSYSFIKWWVDRILRNETEDPRPLLALPLEMGRTSAQDGVISRTAAVDSQVLVKDPASLPLEDQARVAGSISKYIESPWVEWFDEPGTDIGDVESVLAASLEKDPDDPSGEKMRTRFGIVVWDLFDKSLRDLSHSTIAEGLNEVQRLAKTYGVHFLLLAQIKRGVEKRGDKRPTREDVKGSGGWEEVADQILAVHREMVYDPDLEDDTMEIGVLKQRLGPFGMWLTYGYHAPTFTPGEFRDATTV